MRAMFVRRSSAAAIALLIVGGFIASTAEAAAAASPPGAPTGLVVTIGHYGKAELLWKAPASDGGSPITGYVIHAMPESDCGEVWLTQAGLMETQCYVDYGVTYTFSVAAVNDVDQVNEGSPSNAVSVTPTPMLSVANNSVVEGNSGLAHLSFVVSLDGSSALPVTFGYRANNGTAKAGEDFVATAGSRTIAAGQTQTTIDVPVNGDTRFEANESMTLALATPTNAVFRRRTAAGGIDNDDAMPSVSVADASHVERTGGAPTSMKFTFTLSEISGAATRVYWTTVDGTAQAPGDYTAAGGSVLIRAGRGSVAVVVRVQPDAMHEPNETFGVHVNIVNGATIARGDAVGTIVNDD